MYPSPVSVATVSAVATQRRLAVPNVIVLLLLPNAVSSANENGKSKSPGAELVLEADETVAKWP